MSEVSYIKVWCEYDFNGSFGGNNNEEVMVVETGLSRKEVNTLVYDYLRKVSRLGKEGLEGLWDWEFIEVKELK